MRISVFLAGLLAVVICGGAAAAGDDDGFRLLEIDGQQVKWGAPLMGTGASITYAVASDSSSAAGIENCRKTTGIHGLLSLSHLSREQFRQALSQALALWSDVADVRFVPAEAGMQADLVITAEADPDGVAYSDVAPASAGGTVTSIARAVVCLNPQVSWSADQSDARTSYRLFYVLAHEIGHTIGLDHPGPSGVLMSFEYSRTLQTLQAGDIKGAVALYGTAHRKIIAAHTALR